MARELDLSKPLSDDVVADLKSRYPLEYVQRMVDLASETGSADKTVKGVMAEGSDPGEFTVDEVKDFLLTASDEEAERVLKAEADGKARKSLLESD